jgi:hypothetical protein
MIHSSLDAPSFLEHLCKAVEAELVKAAEPYIQKCLKEVEAEIRAKLGAVACSLLTQYDVYFDRKELMIRIKNDIKL